MKGLRILPPLLLSIQSFLPVCELVSLLAELDFTLYDARLYALVCTVSTIAVTVTLLLCELAPTRPRNGIYLLILPMSIINGLCWGAFRTAWAAALALVDVGFVAIVFYRRAGSGRILVSMLCLLLGMFAAWIGSLVHFIGGMTHDTVVWELTSPQGSYTAQIIDNSQGAMGGATYVDVQDHRGDVDLLVGRFSRREIRIYSGKTGEYQDLQIEWLDEQTLIINGERYRWGDET